MVPNFRHELLLPLAFERLWRSGQRYPNRQSLSLTLTLAHSTLETELSPTCCTRELRVSDRGSVGCWLALLDANWLLGASKLGRVVSLQVGHCIRFFAPVAVVTGY
jgi:hypothetical protein